MARARSKASVSPAAPPTAELNRVVAIEVEPIGQAQDRRPASAERR